MTTIATSTLLPVTMRSHVAETTHTETRSREAQAPSCSEEPPRHDGARRSPLYRALIGALRELVAPPAATEAVPAPAPRVDVPSVPAASSDAGDAVEQALMNFTRALMQTLRGERDGPGHHGCGHDHRAHRDNGVRAWGDPARRIELLGTQVAAPVGAGTALATVAPATPSPQTTDGAPLASTTATALRPVDSALRDAFRALQQALGRNEAGASGEQVSIGVQLANFLRSLADRLAQDAPAATDLTTQPGALIDLHA